MDTFYTPESVAERLVTAIDHPDPELIADFTAGSGSLLSVAQARWPAARIVATEINSGVVRQIKECHPDWLTGKCDFLSSRSRGSCTALRGIAGTVDVVLLNPPFSCDLLCLVISAIL